VSPPTVSRFEQGERNITLASALAILDTLGMLEAPALTFPDAAARHDRERDDVLFEGRDADDAPVPCAITGDALAAHFGAAGTGSRARLAAFRDNRRRIENLARQKYTARRTERDGAIRIRSGDVAVAVDGGS